MSECAPEREGESFAWLAMLLLACFALLFINLGAFAERWGKKRRSLVAANVDDAGV